MFIVVMLLGYTSSLISSNVLLFDNASAITPWAYGVYLVQRWSLTAGRTSVGLFQNSTAANPKSSRASGTHRPSPADSDHRTTSKMSPPPSSSFVAQRSLDAEAAAAESFS
jgi:hypothetical protein